MQSFLLGTNATKTEQPLYMSKHFADSEKRIQSSQEFKLHSENTKMLPLSAMLIDGILQFSSFHKGFYNMVVGFKFYLTENRIDFRTWTVSR